MLPLLLFNVISSLVVDKATDLATEHVESMIDDLLPEGAKKELDKAINDSEIAFIAVGTPMGTDGSADLQYVLAAKSIGQSMQKRLIVVDKRLVKNLKR